MAALDAWMADNDTLIVVIALMGVLLAIVFLVSAESRARLHRKQCHELASALLDANTRNEQSLRMVRDLMQVQRKRV